MLLIALVAPDPDVPLDMKKALDIIYERSLYELSIDYQKEPPPPEFGEEEREWMKGL